MASDTPHIRYFKDEVAMVSPWALDVGQKLDLSVIDSHSKLQKIANQQDGFFCCVFFDPVTPSGLENIANLTRLAEANQETNFICVAMESEQSLQYIHERFNNPENIIFLSAEGTNFGVDNGLRIGYPENLEGLLVPSVFLLNPGNKIEKCIISEDIENGLAPAIAELEEYLK